MAPESDSSCPLFALTRLLSPPPSLTSSTIPASNRGESQDPPAGINVRIHARGPGAAGHSGVLRGKLVAAVGDIARPGPHATLTPLATDFTPGEVVFEIQCPLAHTTCPALQRASTALGVFRKEGEYWIISYRGAVVHLKDGKGLHYLDQLLHHPDREFHVLDLMRLDGACPPGEGADPRRARSGGGPSTAAAPLRSDPLLDAKAKQAYRRRLADLRETLGEAERFCDVGRGERARAEIDFLTHELSAAVGLGGRDRATAVPAERARVAVTLRIRAALRRIREVHSGLGLYLDTNVRTGYFCRYTPPPDNSIRWTA